MLSRLGRQSLDHEIVDALDRDDPKVQVYRDPSQDTHQARGVAACFASHLCALRRIVDASGDEAIVAEDDIGTREGLRGTLRSSSNEHP